MSKTFYNRITLSGNRDIELLNTEINYRFIDDYMLHGIANPLAIYRMFYGLTTDEAKELYESDKTKEVTYINNTQYMPTSTGFSLFSDNRELYNLQDLILLFASKLDSHLIVCNQTYNVPINSCATRYVAMHNGKLCEVTSAVKFKPPKKHTLKTDKVIDAIRENVKKEAFKKLKSKVNWVTNAMYRW